MAVGSDEPGDNVGFVVSEAGQAGKLAYFSGAGGITDAVKGALSAASCVFFDGTFWSPDELPAQNLGTGRAADMAHWPVGGEDGSLALLRGLPSRRKIFVHINNTNPLLREDSVERAQITEAGWELGFDGMEILL
jgi:pyrroloquinoline quinone biosynthesis protein B